MGTHSLSRQQARNIQLAAQGLLRPVKRRARFQDISACISRMSLLQIDTINVVASSPYLVLFSRLGDYPPVWLDESLAQGRFSNTGRMKPVLFPAQITGYCGTACCRQSAWAGSTVQTGQRNISRKSLIYLPIYATTGPSDRLISPVEKIISQDGGHGNHTSGISKTCSVQGS